MSKSLTKSDGYPTLLKAVRAEIDKGQTIIERQQVITYWNVGKYISDYILQGEGRAEYGKEVYQKLSKDLNMSISTLERTVRFHREFKISALRQKLRWTHYRTLLGVKEPQKRLELQKKIEERALSADQLQAEINAYRLIQSREKAFKAPETIPQLPLVRGQLYSYKIISPTAKIPINDSVVIDCGFNFWRQIPTSAKGLRAGEIISTVKKDERYQIEKGLTAEKSLYTYKAYLERIIDGDTIVLNIDVGFRNYTRQKVRFNRIDTPEISTELGVKAKAFVEKLLKPLDFFVIKTYKYDKYTRYLVDIFYVPRAPKERVGITAEESDPQAVADKGRLLNQDLLNEGLARSWGE